MDKAQVIACALLALIAGIVAAEYISDYRECVAAGGVPTRGVGWLVCVERQSEG